MSEDRDKYQLQEIGASGNLLKLCDCGRRSLQGKQFNHRAAVWFRYQFLRIRRNWRCSIYNDRSQWQGD